ncbi:uncharacterized protein LOC129250307 [Anastrepha obliqua]|uniref:uncharacterized protein LOC129250307 n=1 Tax=Anastrepha obliqua TaxID=95512 RepID=UPI002409FE5E|nr:uncharacterized protein LOC129250307 [Anastrepha obliqua]
MVKSIWSYIDHNISSDDLTVVAVEGCNNETLLFGSIYMPHDEEAPQKELRKLVETAARKKHGLVVGTDANAHHTVWSSTDINDRGESLFNYILQSSLETANRGEEPTYVGPTSKNEVGLTLYTSKQVMVHECEVLSRLSFPDPGCISFQVIFRSKHELISFRAHKNTNWNLYRNILPKKPIIPRNGRSHVALEKGVELFVTTLVKAFKRSCPPTRNRRKVKPPWWSKELGAERRRVHEF